MGKKEVDHPVEDFEEAQNIITESGESLKDIAEEISLEEEKIDELISAISELINEEDFEIGYMELIQVMYDANIDLRDKEILNKLSDTFGLDKTDFKLKMGAVILPALERGEDPSIYIDDNYWIGKKEENSTDYNLEESKLNVESNNSKLETKLNKLGIQFEKNEDDDIIRINFHDFTYPESNTEKIQLIKVKEIDGIPVLDIHSWNSKTKKINDIQIGVFSLDENHEHKVLYNFKYPVYSGVGIFTFSSIEAEDIYYDTIAEAMKEEFREAELEVMIHFSQDMEEYDDGDVITENQLMEYVINNPEEFENSSNIKNVNELAKANKLYVYEDGKYILTNEAEKAINALTLEEKIYISFNIFEVGLSESFDYKPDSSGNIKIDWKAMDDVYQAIQESLGYEGQEDVISSLLGHGHRH